MLAGLQYPSDYHAGWRSARGWPQQVIAKAQADGSDAVWTGTVPTGPLQVALEANPGNVTATGWTPLLLSSPSQFRPPAPPACDSPKCRPRWHACTTSRGARRLRHQLQGVLLAEPGRPEDWPYRYADKWMFEDGLIRNRAARRAQSMR